MEAGIGIDAGEAPEAWQTWVAEGVGMSGVAKMDHVLKGLRMLDDTPWAADMALMVLTLEDDDGARCFADPPVDQAAEHKYRELHAALEALLLSPAVPSEHVEVGFSWNVGNVRHGAAIDQVSRPDLGLQLWKWATKGGCTDPAWYPRPEWVLAAFEATRRCTLMMPSLWVCMNLLAAMRATGCIEVTMDHMCILMRGRGHTMHYKDLSPAGEALFAEWLEEAAAGTCGHAGVLEFADECLWHSPGLLRRKLQDYNEAIVAVQGTAAP